MKEIDKKNSPNRKQSKYPGRTDPRNDKKHQENVRNKSNCKQFESKTSHAVSESSIKVNGSNIGKESSDNFEDTVTQYVNDVKRFEEVPDGSKTNEMVGKKNSDGLDGHSGDLDINVRERNGESDSEAQHQSTDDETARAQKTCEKEDRSFMHKKIEEMEMRIEKLEEELREVATLEIAIYSVTAEHGSSSHKLHTPARRLSRLYIFACKHWSQEKRATVAKSTVSGLVLVAKSCGNDVPRLTFWLSNIVVLREIIFQSFGNLCHPSPCSMGGDGKSSSLTWRGSTSARQAQKLNFMQFSDDWLETRTLMSALEKVEAWIFSRIVESVWWQVGNLNSTANAQRGFTY